MPTKRAMVIHSNSDYNCGDLLTYYGTKGILKSIYGNDVDILQFDIRRAIKEIDTYVLEFGWGDVDLIVLAGSPWLWNVCEESNKYKLLLDAMKRWPNAKCLGFGLGTCFSHKCYHNIRYDMKDHYFFNHLPRKKILNEIYSRFQYILVRDEFAKILLTRCGVKSNYSYDTSIYAYKYFTPKKNVGDKKILFFYDPSKGLSKDSLGFTHEEYIDYQVDWAKKNNALVYYNAAEEGEALIKRGINYGKFTVDLEYLLHIFSGCDTMLTGRVHMGALGFLAGIKNISVLPVDTRFLSVTKLGIKPVFIGKEWVYDVPKIADNIWEDIKIEENKIIEDIKNAAG